MESEVRQPRQTTVNRDPTYVLSEPLVPYLCFAEPQTLHSIVAWLMRRAVPAHSVSGLILVWHGTQGLGLAAPLCEHLEAMNFMAPTRIQQATIPTLLVSCSHTLHYLQCHMLDVVFNIFAGRCGVRHVCKPWTQHNKPGVGTLRPYLCSLQRNALCSCKSIAPTAS